GAAAPDQRAPQQAQERSPAAAAGDDGPLSRAQGEPDGGLPADARPGPDLLCALLGPVGVGGAAGRDVLLLRAGLRRPSLDLRSREPRSHVYPADPDGHDDVRATAD